MAIVFTGSKTVTKDVAPHLTAATLTALLATAPENLTFAQLKQLSDGVKRISGGHAPAATLGTIFV
jgi:hypothetical protein